MSLYTIDFETFYGDDYSLTKMSTEDYVNDPRFEVILVGIKRDNEPPYMITGGKKFIAEKLAALNLHEHGMLAHNTLFDALILAVHFNIYPKIYFDTLALAQAQLKPHMRSISLDSCLKNIDLGLRKGDEVHNMKNRTRDSLSREEMVRYGQYCMTDCEGTYRLFKYLAGQVPKQEIEIIDMTLRMYLQPQFQLDGKLLAEELQHVQAKKAQALAALPEHVQRADLMSNVKFAALLKTYGIDPPIKISPLTGKETYAFAKTDTEWKELEEELADHPELSPILAARVSSKSTLEETRLIRMIGIKSKYPYFRMPLRYYAAHTGRYGGMESINAQNFPRIDKSKMRFAIRAPKGHVVIAADLAQIEARITAWLAGQQNLLTGFRNREDIYSDFASVAFGVKTVKDRSPEDKKRRFVGKTCILGLGYGMGAPRLRTTLRKDMQVELTDCERWVNVYRDRYSAIPSLWRHFDQRLPYMADGRSRFEVGPVTLMKHSIVLPNGMALAYPNLRHVKGEKYEGFVYDFAGVTRTLWGGKVTENVVQALARILIMEYMLKIKHTIGLKPSLQQHDELDYIVPETYAEKIVAVVTKLMRVPPSWAPDLPVEVEVNYGPTLGDCK